MSIEELALEVKIIAIIVGWLLGDYIYKKNKISEEKVIQYVHKKKRRIKRKIKEEKYE